VVHGEYTAARERPEEEGAVRGRCTGVEGWGDDEVD
jgi:hypothetical protein